MRILSIIDSLGNGGAEQVLVRLVAGLPGHEHAVIHCSRVNAVPVHGPHVRALRRAGAILEDVDWRVFADPGRRAAAMGGSVPEIVICHWWGGTPWRAWMDELADAQPGAGRPWFVCVLHATGRPAPRGFDRYVVLADLHRSQVPDGGRVAVIPNGVDLAVFHAARRPRTTGPSSLRIGRLARLDPGKTPDGLVRTMDGWSVPRARWELAGDGSLRPTLAAQAAALADPSTVRLLGALPHRRVAPWLRGLDVVFHLTGDVSECHPLALLEALACGVPVVAERRGGIPEIVRDGQDGLLGDSPDEVGAHLRRMAGDRDLLARLTAGARADGRRFDVAHQLAAWRTLLVELGG
ncbi:MAG: glycosyltransferase family 4 protein [Chloroflexota bacterium]